MTMFLSAHFLTFVGAAHGLHFRIAETQSSMTSSTPPVPSDPKFKPHGNGIITAIFGKTGGVHVYQERYEKAGGQLEYYIPELQNLCATLDKYSPGLSLSIITDSVEELQSQFSNCKSLQYVIQNNISIKPGVSWAEKPAALLQSPYEKTIFLDVDTSACSPLGEVFGFLDQYDIAMAPEPFTMDDINAKTPVPMHKHFHMNSGVIVYRNHQDMRAFFRKIQEIQTGGDQHYFHLWGTPLGLLGKTETLRVLQLPPEFNLRVPPVDALRLLTGPVRVIHGKQKMNVTCEAVNRDTGFRLWSAAAGAVKLDHLMKG